MRCHSKTVEKAIRHLKERANDPVKVQITP